MNRMTPAKALRQARSRLTRIHPTHFYMRKDDGTETSYYNASPRASRIEAKQAILLCALRLLDIEIEPLSFLMGTDWSLSAKEILADEVLAAACSDAIQ